MTIKTYIGNPKNIYNLRIKLVTFTYFLLRVLAGEIRIIDFPGFLKRLLYFLSKMKENKYVKVGKYTKINLYVPGFPSKAFFYACRKVISTQGKMPAITALVSITSACRYNCEHCYQKHDKGKDVELDILVDTVKNLQEKGVAFFNIEGGEPFLVFDRLEKVCEALDDRSEILINSTGDGITEERLLILKKRGNLAGIMFSLHTADPDKLNNFMNFESAWDTLEQGINMCHKTGVPVMFNACVGMDAYTNGDFERIMDRAMEFGGTIVQLIKPKAAGGWLYSGADHFDDQLLKHIKILVYKYNSHKAYKHYPFIAAMVNDEAKEMFGCTAGGTDRFYINAKGDLQPCEFLNVSFGNIATDDFEKIYEDMRRMFHDPGDCWLCDKYGHQIAKAMNENNISTLPLPPDLSKNILKQWDRGSIPEFYENVSKL